MRPAVADFSGPLAERGQIKPDVAELISYELPTWVAPSRYQPLDVGTCQCRAAAHSTLGNLLDAERRTLLAANSTQCGVVDPGVCLQAAVLACRAVEERNRSAADALTLYYRLAEAEANRDVLRASLGEIDQSLANVERIRQKGFQLPIDEGQLQRERIDLLGKQIQVHQAIDQLNGQLHILLGRRQEEEPVPFWPTDELRVTTAPIDVEAAVWQGLATRADLRMVRMLQQSLNLCTLAAIRSSLGQVDALAGSSAAGPCKGLRACLTPCRDQVELERRRQQLSSFLAASEQIVAGEICMAAHTVEISLQEVALASRKRDSWQANLDRLDQKRAAAVPDGVSEFDLSVARMELQRADSELIRQVVVWKIALVELRKAQGLLAEECGYHAPQSACCK